MRLVLSLLLLMPATALPRGYPHTYLLSIIDLPVKGTQSVKAFSFDTWGVEFRSVCHIPGGWRIKAGSSATPNGELAGEGSQGATWFNHRSPSDLRRFALVTLYAPLQRADIGTANVSGQVPATFKGSVTVETDDGDKLLPLTYRNIALTPATLCRRR